MNGWDDAAAILRALPPLAWTLVVGFGIYILRHGLIDLLNRVTGLKYKDWSVTAESQSADAANAAKTASALPADSALPEKLKAADSTAATDPAAAVLASWSAVEETLARLPALNDARSPSVVQAAADLKLPTALTDAAATLSALRTQAAARPGTISPATATNFVSGAKFLYGALDHALARAEPQPAGTPPARSVHNPRRSRVR